MTGQSGVYGRRLGHKLGIVYSDDAIADDTETTIAETGNIVVDLTDGAISYVDADTKTQILS